MDGIAAALSGAILYATLHGSAVLRLNTIIQNMFCSAVTAISVLLLVRAGIGVQPDKIMIGDIMLVIPGLQLTNSLRDMINGDMISGLLNMSEALLKAVAVAIGFAGVIIWEGQYELFGNSDHYGNDRFRWFCSPFWRPGQKAGCDRPWKRRRLGGIPCMQGDGMQYIYRSSGSQPFCGGLK